ncbi:hypothetical protein Aperf_G00000109079 [Anoplocephala perfoliata]
MTDNTPETAEYLDEIDSDNYIVGVIHIPPGCNARNLLNSASQPTLNKFFRRLARHPEKKMRKILPTSKHPQNLELISEGESSRTRMPFLGKSSKGGHCLRFLNVHRLQIHLTDKIDIDFDDADDEQDAPPKIMKRSIPGGFTSSDDAKPPKRKKTLKSEF